MSIGSFLKKIIPVAKTTGTIVVTEGTGGTLAATALRQVLLVGGTYLASKGIISGDDVQSVVSAVVVVGTAVYGQLKTNKEHTEKAVLADAAPNGVVVPK